MRTGLPFELTHINLWLMEGKDAWAAIDSGFNGADTQAAWEAVFKNVFGAKPLKHLFITHFHPDHYGLAGWLAERTDTAVHMTQKEYDMAHTLTNMELADGLAVLYRPYYAQAGVPDNMAEDLLKRRFSFKNVIYKPPSVYNRVGINDVVTLADRAWQVIAGYGHSPEHACLYNAEDKIFIAGDIVLPDISPNISYFPDVFLSPNPLAAYLETLDRILQLVPDDVTVLPSHGVPFTGLHGRIAELRAHHDRRLEKLRAVFSSAQKPLTGFEAMRGLFSHRPIERPADIFFALGETLAHLIYEEQAGRITRAVENDTAVFSLISTH